MLKRVVFWLIFMPLAAFGQQSKPHAAGDTAIKALPARLAEYYATYPTEKAYLQFDKPYYAIGDTIYFKAYVVIREQHKLSALSGVLNVDLISPDNKIVRTEKLQLIAGVAWADFVLADSLKNGNYRIRAYTNWMRNESEDSFFWKIISVAGVAKKSESNKEIVKKAENKPAVNSIDIQFLPEGGSFVAGNYSKIAFKAVDQNGQGVDLKGVIVDERGEEVTTLASTHLGMGSFYMVPQVGKSYKANVTFADGSHSTRELPTALLAGYTLSVNYTNPDTIRIRVTAGGSGFADGLSLAGQSGGVLDYVVENQQSGSKFFSVAIPASKFPTGIAQFTLFSASGEPLNERLIFVDHEDRLKLNLNLKRAYNTREKVKIDLASIFNDSKPATASFSVAVTDEAIMPVDTVNENTIVSNLLLTSELKGTVEQPNYYFTEINERTRAALDNLMLTQGYRYFNWKKILSDGEPNIKFQPEKGLSISGKVSKWGKPFLNAKVKLFSNKGGTFMLDTVTDKDGRFAFNDLMFEDSTKFVIQSKVPKGQDAVTLDLDTTFSHQLELKTNFHPVITDISADFSGYLLNQRRFYEEQQRFGINKHEVVLREVKVQARYEAKIPDSQNLNGSGGADYTFTAKDIEKMICTRLTECLQGRIPRVRFINDVPVGMALVIDGNFVDADMFTTLNPDDIEGIEVIVSLHYASIYGSRMANGGIIVTTKRAKKQNQYYRYAPGVVTYMPKGFYKAREFYSPQYDNPHTNQKMADLRSTIYWNPNIITDKDGKASFSYFNADGKGTYRVVIEGIDADGNLGRQVYRYKVE
ncbi:MAG TPA: TonB-dependent receptor [Mucilaginibacter sp.]